MKKKSFKQRVDGFFGISKKGSSFKVEIIAGIATFLAMAYILTVNPNQILYGGSADPRWSSIFIATAFGAIFGTLMMSLYAKMPLAQASGMGLNSTLGSVIGGGVGAFAYGYTYSLPNALFLVFLSGIVFLLLSIIPLGHNKEGKAVTLRERIYDGMPESIRKAIPVGIGFFIAFIGLQNAKIISANQYTLVQLVDFTKVFEGLTYTNELGAEVVFDYAYALVALISFFSIAILSRFKVKGAVIFGIIIATVIAIPLQVANTGILLGEQTGISWKFWESFGAYFGEDGVFFAMFKGGADLPAGSLFTSIMLVVTFCMIDMFDTMGTVVGCTANAGLVDETGKPLNYDKIMLSDSAATCAGSLFGTSTVTTFVESGTGIAAGGRTGMSSLVTAILFALAIFFLPLFAFIPSSAAAGALMYVGVLMMKNVKDIDFKSVRGSCTSFMTILMMVLTYSITKGIGLGVVTYVVITVVSNVFIGLKYAFASDKSKVQKPKWDISVVLWVVFALFLVYFMVPTVF